jgi:formate-dependent nitrite reductase cytochrome c552 subunit
MYEVFYGILNVQTVKTNCRMKAYDGKYVIVCWGCGRPITPEEVCDKGEFFAGVCTIFCKLAFAILGRDARRLST